MLVGALRVLYLLAEDRRENRLLWGCVVSFMTRRDVLRHGWVHSSYRLRSSYPVMCCPVRTTLPSALWSMLVQLSYQVVKQPVTRLSIVS